MTDEENSLEEIKTMIDELQNQLADTERQEEIEEMKALTEAIVRAQGGSEDDPDSGTTWDIL